MNLNPERLAAYLKLARPWFTEWRSPAAFERRLLQINGLMDGKFLFNKPDLQWYREALTLVDYSAHVVPHRIRLSSQSRPDAYAIWQAGTATPVEITEVMEPGRERGLEYRDEDSGWRFDRVEDWHKRIDCIPLALREGIQKKERRAYPKGTVLLVYLNISGHGIRQVETESAIRAIVAGVSNFASIDVIWQRKLFSSRDTQTTAA